MNFKHFITGSSSKPAETKSERATAPSDPKSAPAPEPLKANSPPTNAPPPPPSTPAPPAKDSAKAGEKPQSSPPPAATEATKATEGGSGRAATGVPSPPAEVTKAAPTAGETAAGSVPKKSDAPSVPDKSPPTIAPDTKSPESEPPGAKPADEPKPSIYYRLFRGPTIEAKGRQAPAEPAKAAKAKHAQPAAHSAPPAAAAEAATKPAEPEKKPEPPPAPKAATWKSLPARDDWCPPEIAKHFPDLARHAQHDSAAFDRVLASGWRIVGATRRGRDHANKGTHREDALAFAVRGPLTVLCVSDGAGSCRFSRIGSNVASRTVTDSLLASLESVEPAVADDREKLVALLKSKLTDAVIAACQSLGDMAAKCGCSPKDFRCTLITALHWRGEKHEAWLVGQVGDGAVCVLRKDHSSARIGTGDSGEFSGEVGCFVPDPEARTKAATVEVLDAADTVECVLLCSDGIEDPFYPIAKKCADVFRQFYCGVEKPLEYLKSQKPQPALATGESAAWALAEWIEFEKQGEFDDRTALVMHRHPSRMTNDQ